MEKTRIILAKQGYTSKAGKDAQGLTLGIKGKKAYNVYKYMDSTREEKYTDPYLKIIGAESWNAIVLGYKL